MLKICKIYDQTRVIQLTILLYIKINAENVDSEIALGGTKYLKGSTKQELLMNDRKNILVKGILQPLLNKLRDGKVIFCKYISLLNSIFSSGYGGIS